MNQGKHVRKLEFCDPASKRWLLHRGNLPVLKGRLRLNWLTWPWLTGRERLYHRPTCIREGAIKPLCIYPLWSNALNIGIYDLYWIVVDPAVQVKCLGNYLLEYVERDVIRRGSYQQVARIRNLPESVTTRSFFQKYPA